jgi:hypothetical protein
MPITDWNWRKAAGTDLRSLQTQHTFPHWQLKESSFQVRCTGHARVVFMLAAAIQFD